MGHCESKVDGGKSVHAVTATEVANAKDLTSRIHLALRVKRDEMQAAGTSVSFEKILLRFDRMRKVLRRVKSVFAKYAVGGGLNFEGLHKAMSELHENISREEVIELFQFVDIDSSKIIELKEFLVALTCGYVLESIPTFRSINRNSESGSEIAARGSGAAVVPEQSSSKEEEAEESELKKMLNLITLAYLLFDPQCEGVINKKSLERWVEEGGVKQHKNKELTEHLWKLMDCDANGEIDFPEFVHTFSDWIDVEGEEDDEEELGA